MAHTAPDKPSHRLHAGAWRLLFWTGAAIATALIGVGVTAVVIWAQNQISPPPPPLDTQVEHVIRQEADAGLTLAFSKDLDFRGTGKKSRVMVFTQEFGVGQASDDLRIYDVSHGWLRLSFEFRPTHPPQGLRYGIEIIAAGDLSQRGKADLVAVLNEEFTDGILRYPLTVYWNEKASSFRITPFLVARDLLLPPAGSGLGRLKVIRRKADLGPGGYDAASDYQAGYLTPARIVDGASRSHLVSLGGQDFLVVPGREPVLVGDFIAEAGPCRMCVKTIEVLGWRLDFSAAPPTARPCYGRKPRFLTVPGMEDFTPIATQAWASAGVLPC